MKKAIGSIYAAGLVQGIALVAFPAASTILTNPEAYHFSSTEYGSLFIPQSILSIISAALNPLICRRLGSKSVFIAGLCANLLSMALLAFSAIVMHHHFFSYLMLLFATGCLGIGFGLVVPTVNTMSALLYPQKIDSILLTLNALLGLGTALAPVFIILFVSVGFWWGLPFLLAFLFLLLIFVSIPLPLPGGKIQLIDKQETNTGIPGRFWLFAAFALLYGVIETLNGNWVSIYMQNHLQASIQMQSLALTSFWGMVTFGRIFFAGMSKFISEEKVFQIAPFVSTLAFLLIAWLSSGEELWAIVAFGLTGFGCSVLLPLIISFGSKQLKCISESVPGMIISSYLLGYGIAAFGVGPLEDFTSISLRTDYVIGAGISFFLGIISFFIINKKKEEVCNGNKF